MSYLVWGPHGWVECDYTTLDRITPTLNGRKHPNPQHWQYIRALALKRDLGCCVLDKRHTYRLEVHHRTYERWGRERLSDVYTLCRACHEKHHGREDANVLALPIPVVRRAA